MHDDGSTSAFSSRDGNTEMFFFFQFTLQGYNTETSKQIFPGKKLRGFNPNSYIHSVSGLYIPLIGLPFLLQENRRA